MKRAKRFSSGDEVEYFGSSIGKSESVPAASSSESSTKFEAPAKKQSFSEAFAAARARGDKDFAWEGKPGMKFSTNMREDKPAPKAESAPSKPTPKAEEPAKPAPKAEESKRGIGPHNVFAGPSDKEKADTYAKYAENREKMGGSAKPSGSGKISDSDWAKSVRSSQAAAESDGESLGRKFRKAMGSSYAKGGSVSSASKRADGIAQRGKTRGKMC